MTARTPYVSKFSMGLLALSAVPVGAGAVRLLELAGRPEVTIDNARFVTAPLPITLHITSSAAFAIAGALQFSPRLRRRRWHRRAGWVALPAGVLSASTGLWLSLASDLPVRDGDLLRLFRVGFGAAMVGSLACGAAALRRRDVSAHRAWLSRAYAIGLGAGTQALVLGPWIAGRGEPAGATRAWLMFAGWAINLGLVEWRLIKDRTPPRAPAQVTLPLGAVR